VELFVYSRSAIAAVRPHDAPHVIISITSHEEDHASLRTNAACRGVLRLSFVDAETPSAHHPEETLFSTAHAASIWEFVYRHRPQIERILAHCDAGVSRSAAVAAAIARVLNGDDAEFSSGRYRPSARVYRMLIDAHEGARRA
jgi:predicted protein tyrosine phosphatase